MNIFFYLIPQVEKWFFVADFLKIYMLRKQVKKVLSDFTTFCRWQSVLKNKSIITINLLDPSTSNKPVISHYFHVIGILIQNIYS